MPSSASARLALTTPLGTEAADGPANIATLISQLESRAAGFLQGTFASLPSPAAGNAGYVYWSTDTKHLYFSTGSAWQKIDFRADMPTAFPGSPVQGDETIILAAFARGRTYWRFAYDASGIDAYKWIYVGGAPQVDIGTAGGTFAGDNAAHQPVVAGNYPALTLPFPGKFIIRYFAQAHPGSGAPTYFRAALLRNGTLYDFCEVLANGTRTLSASGVYDSTESTAGATFSVAVQSDAGSWSVDDWRIEATPVRVSA